MDHLQTNCHYRSIVAAWARPVRSRRRIVRSIFCFVLLSAIYGCGGGGSGAQPANAPPAADAGADQIVNEGETVVLDGSRSSDPDGEIVSYLWVQVEGVEVSLTNADSVSASFSAPVTGVGQVLVFQLTAWDDAGASSSDNVTITVNAPPTVNAGLDQFSYGDRPVRLNGMAVDDDGFVVSHVWEQIAGTEVVLTDAESPAPGFTAPAATGTLTFRYTVRDNHGAQRSDIVSVHVSRVLFSDTFDSSSSAGNWQVLNDTGNAPFWSVEDGEFYQKNNVVDSAMIKSYHTGTFAYLVESALPRRSAFRFSVDITPRTNDNGSGAGNDIGIMFPYAARNDYYRLTMNARCGFTRFEKRVGGTTDSTASFQTLAVNSIGYVYDEQVNITVEVVEGTVVVLIDGDPIFAETDLDITEGTVALYSQDRVSFDNVVIAENSPRPMVVISSPLAHSVRPAKGNDFPLDVRAVVLNNSLGGSVAFFLDGEPEVEAIQSGTWHIASLDVANGDFALHAVLRDPDGNEMSRDINDAVGIGGNYIIAVGDSITNGIGDEYPFNNDSLDGRIVSRQGFQARLADGLTRFAGLPQIVFNEGILRSTSIDIYTNRIASILERHPRANKMIFLIGTNDAVEGTPADAFGSAVTHVVDMALDEGVDKVFIARVLPFFNTAPIYNGAPSTEVLNERVIELNSVVDTIVTGPGNALPGPDFHALFNQHPDDYFASDGFHPNDTGYEAMADAWLDILALP